MIIEHASSAYFVDGIRPNAMTMQQKTLVHSLAMVRVALQIDPSCLGHPAAMTR